MYLVKLKTLLVKALTTTFDAAYPVEAYRGLYASLDYPIDKAGYPGIWVDWEGASLQNAGVGHTETVDGRRVKRWRFSGTTTFTIVALSSLERDGLYDEMVKVIAFGQLYHATNPFRQTIHENDYLGISFDWDNIHPRGESSIPGTPWDTDDVIYEVTIGLDTIGEFVSEPDDATLVPLSAVAVYPYRLGTTPPGGDDGWA